MNIHDWRSLLPRVRDDIANEALVTADAVLGRGFYSDLEYDEEGTSKMN